MILLAKESLSVIDFKLGKCGLSILNVFEYGSYTLIIIYVKTHLRFNRDNIFGIFLFR